jgi:hypothetical protein
MSLAGFQSALADLVASPALCLALRESPDAVAGYPLTPLERARLQAVVRQRGMSANCTVYRATRLTPLYTMLPLSFAALGPALAAELDDYWAAAPRLEVRFDLEIARFEAHLAPRLRAGRTAVPHPAAVADLLALETALETARLGIPAPAPASTPGRPGWRLAPAFRLVPLRHAPAALLEAARRTPPDFAHLPETPSLALVAIAQGSDVEIAVPDPSLADALRALAAGTATPHPRLIEAGLAVRARECLVPDMSAR